MVEAIAGENKGDGSGNTVSLSADSWSVAIGLQSNSDNGPYSGHINLFVVVAGAWT